METIFKLWAGLKGYRTYISSGLTVLGAVAYAVFTWDIVTAAGFVGLSSQAAALRAAIDDMKKAADEKVFGPSEPPAA